MNYYPFDSRNTIYRSNIGAVAADFPLRLRVLLHKDALVWDVFLRFQNDGDGAIQEIQMHSTEMCEDYYIYECEISLSEGLYWYDFRYTSEYGQFFIIKSDASLGIVSRDQGAKWQQTVYLKDFSTPDWLKGGIIYQIFPDRFFASKSKKKNVPEDRFICTDWSKTPEHRQTDDICSLGNDYYGGDLKGIQKKLPYLKSLGVTCIYLNPIFEAHSNHRYNTADYNKIDPLLGDEKDFINLCAAAKKNGIHIILDGVFSHTGDDSIYFNRQSRYGEGGAYQKHDSPYNSWYKFKQFPDDYEAWWGIKTLPEINEDDPDYTEFITGKNGVVQKWLYLGADGWRLDVADELPDTFLKNVRKAVKSSKKDAFLLGEVWEDATNKISYNARRSFLRGGQLDSVMNYPFANGIIDFIKHGNGLKICNVVLDILENYPPEAVALLMNHIGTHDTARILTVLGAQNEFIGGRETQANTHLSPNEYNIGIARLKCAAVIQYTLPGVPSLYYGDEAGVEGYGDPFCRRTYPWGNENHELLNFYRKLGALRIGCPAFKSGSFVPYICENDIFSYSRTDNSAAAFIAVNRGDMQRQITITSGFEKCKNVFGVKPNGNTLTLNSCEYTIITV